MTGETGFGDLLRRYRVAAGFTQEELAERAGVSTRGISDLERGARGLPRKDTLQLLLQALDLPDADSTALRAAARRAPVALGGAPIAGHAPFPVPLTPLIGREDEIASITAQLRNSAVRLLTLTGPGGTGKTRLGLAVAERVGARFANGARFVELAALTDPSLVTSAIAHELGVPEDVERRLLDSLKTHLVDKQMLLVLDNFEHVLHAAPLVAELLAGCPFLKALVTSRIRIQVRGEREVLVEPLDLPPSGRLAGVEDLAGVPAVRLFVARAQDVKTDFVLTEQNAPAIAEICQRLDGLPLALELAAARTKILSPAALLARLDRSLPLLIGGPQDLPDRQRTLRDTIAWSYDLLRENEQTLFRSLAVFTGGFTLEAAEAVINATDTVDVLEGVTALVEQSLVQHRERANAEPRFTMLETIREFALELLEASEDADQRRLTHAQSFVALAERLRPKIEGADGAAVLNQFEVEHGNLRAALDWAEERGDAELLQRLVAALWKFWWVRNYLTEGRDWSERALARDGDSPSLRLEVMYAAGSFARRQGDFVRAATLGEQGVTLAEAQGDNLHAAMLTYLLALVADDQGDVDTARTRVEGALNYFRALPSSHWLASHGIAIALHTFGDLATRQGDLDAAVPALEEALAVWQQRGDAWGTALAFMSLAELALQRDEPIVAAQHYREALARYWEVGDKRGIAVCLESLGWLAVRDHPERATQLLALTEVVRDEIGDTLGADQARHDEAITVARNALGEDRFRAARSTGRTKPLEEMVTEVMAQDPFLAEGPQDFAESTRNP